jgi:hypothetical protein
LDTISIDSLKGIAKLRIDPDGLDRLRELSSHKTRVHWQVLSLLEFYNGDVFTPNPLWIEPEAGRMAKPKTKDTKQASSNNATITKLYPNPSDGTTEVEFELRSNVGVIEVNDCIGRIVYTETIKTGQTKLNLKLNLMNGLYWCVLKDQQGNKSIKKLVITK